MAAIDSLSRLACRFSSTTPARCPTALPDGWGPVSPSSDAATSDGSRSGPADPVEDAHGGRIQLPPQGGGIDLVLDEVGPRTRRPALRRRRPSTTGYSLLPSAKMRWASLLVRNSMKRTAFSGFGAVATTPAPETLTVGAPAVLVREQEGHLRRRLGILRIGPFLQHGTKVVGVRDRHVAFPGGDAADLRPVIAGRRPGEVVDHTGGPILPPRSGRARR